MQHAGHAAYDGYMLRTNQLSRDRRGLPRALDNGAVTTLLDDHSGARGRRHDPAPARKGSKLEAWRNDGSSWSRLGVVDDATYSRCRLRRHRHARHDRPPRRLRRAHARRRRQHRPDRTARACRRRAGNAQVALTWSAPRLERRRRSITGYKIYRGTTRGQRGAAPARHALRARPTPTRPPRTAPPTTTRVTAVNAVGERPASNEASATPTAPATVPDRPRRTCRATAGNAQVALTWSAPPRNGGSSVTGYKVYRGTSSGGEASTPIALGPGHELHRHDRRQRHDLLLQGDRGERGRRGRCLERGAARRPRAPATVPEPARRACGDRRQRPGRPHVERSASQRRLAAHRLQHLPRHELGRREPASRRLGTVHDLHRHAAPPTAPPTTTGVTAVNAVGESRCSNERVGDAARTGHRARRPPEPAATAGNGPGRARPGPLLRSDGGSSVTGYKRLPRHEPGRRDLLATRRHRHDLHRHERRPTAPPTTTRSARERGRRGPALERGARATPSAPATAPRAPQNLRRQPATPRSRSPGRAPASDGGSSVTGYKDLPLARPRVTRPSSRRALGTGTTYTDSQRRQRHHLLLQGVRASTRSTRARYSNEALGDAERSRPARRAADHPRYLQPRQREPALVRRSLGQRHRRELGARPQGRLEPVRKRSHDDGDRLVDDGARTGFRGLRRP